MIERLGTNYGGWVIPKNIKLNKNSIVYSVGVGEDISFDILLSHKYNCNILLIDPTEKAIKHWEEVKNYILNDTKFTGNIQPDYYKTIDPFIKNINLEKIKYINKGLWDTKGELKFYKQSNPDYVSQSLVSNMFTGNYDIVSVDTLKNIMGELGHTHIDLLKLDIEGAEIKVLESMIDQKIFPKYLCIEFDLYLKGKDDENLTQKLINKLKCYNYEILANEQGNLTFKLVKKQNEFAVIIPVYNNLYQNPDYKVLINSWERYCKEYNIDFILLEGKKDNTAEICFDRWTDFIPEKSYKRILYVDGDTYVRKETPNLFEEFEKNNLRIVAVPDQGGSGPYHLNQWKDYNPDWDIMSLPYFNAGFISFPIDLFLEFQKLIPKYKDYYFKNHDNKFHPIGVGVENGIRMDALDQTGVNICIQKELKELTLLQHELNYQPVNHNNPELRVNKQVYTTDNRKKLNNLDFLNKGFIFHFGSSTINRTNISEILDTQQI